KKDLLPWLEGTGRGFALTDIGAALIHGREHFAVRSAVSGRTREELVAGLSGDAAEPGAEGSDSARLQALAGEYLEGADPEGWGLYEWSAQAALDLPTYPFERVRCWVVARGTAPKNEERTPFPTEVKSKPQEIVLLGLESFDPPVAVDETPAAPPAPELLSSADEASIEALLEQIYSGEVDLEQAIQQVDRHSGRGRG
ncbi:MAG: hypothetical protein JWN02_1833, partial [Acidobacteria bacterium]|nr:hypothetical protein [Acidobacteriota bacterium]